MRNGRKSNDAEAADRRGFHQGADAAVEAAARTAADVSKWSRHRNSSRAYAQSLVPSLFRTKGIDHSYAPMVSKGKLTSDESDCPCMRDIRPDLKERLTTAESRRNRLNSELAAIEGEVRAVMALLEIEDQRQAQSASQPKRTPSVSLEEFIKDYLRLLGNGYRITKDEVRIAAQNEGFDITGRNVHAYFLKLQNEGLLEKEDDDTFKILALAA